MNERGQKGGGRRVRKEGDEWEEEHNSRDVPYLFVEPIWLDIHNISGPISQHQRPCGREREEEQGRGRGRRRESSPEIESELEFEQELSVVMEPDQGPSIESARIHPFAPTSTCDSRLNQCSPFFLARVEELKEGNDDHFGNGTGTDTCSPSDSSGDLPFCSESPSHTSNAGVVAVPYGCAKCSSVFERAGDLK